MDSQFDTLAVAANFCGTGSISDINVTGGDNNPFTGSNGCGQNNYMTRITGQLVIPLAGTYKFGIDGDDSVDVTIGTSNWGWYGGHGQGRSDATFDAHSKTITFNSPGTFNVTFRHLDTGGGDGWGLAMQREQPANSIVDYNLRVEVCPAGANNDGLREASCKPYPNAGGQTVYKPTGLLHEFGESEKMYFGLLTGSYEKNIAGGTLRRNIGNFADEVDAVTGQFKSSVQGIVYNIDHQRSVGYNGSTWGTCGWITDKAISKLGNPSDCAMWGNPIGEMMYETLRYFGGASQAYPTYAYGNASSTKDAKLGLSKPAWVSPYKAKSSGGGGYEHCAKPVMTVISDINPSYDGKVPGSRYSDVSNDIAALSGFNASTEADSIGSDEGINGKKFFIGQSETNNADQAPSVKTINALSWARGLSPLEPSKEGTYYSAAVARFAAKNAVFGKGTNKNNKMMTYSVAIASPLPEIRFPVGDGKFITVAPFAKSVTGYNIDNTKFTPTNQIVDFYVDKIANTGTADVDANVNGGRAYAEFRINYEDVEQGADHDMDAITRYVIALQEDGKTVKINLISEFAAGGIGQHMGYVISGTTADGMYLDVRDKDTGSVFYKYNTPQGRQPGFCARAGLSDADIAECTNLGLQSIRSFTPGTAESGSFLKGPLWYAAKYGLDTPSINQKTGDPDNYFLVTNATTLKDQMTKAFNSILQNTTSVTAANVSQTSADLSDGVAVFNTSFEADFWSGDVIRKDITEGVKSTTWSAAEELAKVSYSDRKIYYGSKKADGSAELVDFKYSVMSGRPNDAAWITALNLNPTTLTADGKAEQRIDFLRGNIDNTVRVRHKLPSDKYNVLGDIVNSSLVRVNGGRYRPGAADKLEGTTKYEAYLTSQAANTEMIYVGSNDGMLHAFNAGTGKEEFAFVPSSAKTTLSILTSPNYGTAKGLAHRYFVDGTPIVTDVYFGNDWHKVLIGNMGAGGRQIFALDVTNPTTPKLLWEFGEAQSTDMGYAVPQPTVARLNNSADGGSGKWVVLLPNGYQGLSSTAGNANLFVLDIANGNVLRKFDLPGGMTATELTASLPIGNGLSSLSAIDNNADGMVDMAYAGDLAGNLWRFDLNSGAPTAWTAQTMFVARDKATAGARQPITAAPYVLKHPTGPGDLVIVGTGRFLSNADKESTQQQTMYGIWDRYSAKGTTAPATLPSASKTRDDLHQQTFTAIAASTNYKLTGDAVTWYKTGGGTTDDDVNSWGWYVDLPRTGEQMVYDMKLYGKSLVFNSIRTSEDPCQASITGTIYAIDPNDGGKTDFTAFDMNNDGKYDTSDQINNADVNGTEFDPGKTTIAGGKAIPPGGKTDGLGVNSGVERGRQSWRRQPT
ncbi:fimbrial assembly protein [Diaphorobacter sp. NR2-3-3-1]|nr:fimbrial assembly protein [Diaphorobacter caeni]